MVDYRLLCHYNSSRKRRSPPFPSIMVCCVRFVASCLELGSAAGRGFQEALFGEVRPVSFWGPSLGGTVEGFLGFGRMGFVFSALCRGVVRG